MVKMLFRPRRMINPCQEPNTPNKASAFCLFCFMTCKHLKLCFESLSSMM
ncbi:hypothetical protein HanPSC8_Chr17g0769881 [Helianthus annuus]|nr:hypothetical protein HanPSC8_Chr17g0769881 [Helianthus annuus]